MKDLAGPRAHFYLNHKQPRPTSPAISHTPNLFLEVRDARLDPRGTACSVDNDAIQYLEISGLLCAGLYNDMLGVKDMLTKE